jgi:hypothetical protein
MAEGTKSGGSDLQEVVWPLGRSAYKPFALRQRLPDLNGKTVAELWDRVFRGEEIFPALRAELKALYPDIRIVDYEECGDTHGPKQKEVLEGLPAFLRERKVDAVISGVGA